MQSADEQDESKGGYRNTLRSKSIGTEGRGETQNCFTERGFNPSTFHSLLTDMMLPGAKISTEKTNRKILGKHQFMNTYCLVMV